jgi:uncharacterized membrane protein
MAVFTAYIFDGDKTAQKVLGTLENSDNDYVWIDDVAMIAKNSSGRLTIHSTWAQNDMGASGFGWGAFTGGLLGLMASPASALAGAALGGSLWGLFGLTMDEVLDDPRLNEFGEKLKKDTSALVLVSDEDYINDYESALEPFNGVVVQTDLDETDVDYIKKKLKEKS